MYSERILVFKKGCWYDWAYFKWNDDDEKSQEE